MLKPVDTYIDLYSRPILKRNSLFIFNNILCNPVLYYFKCSILILKYKNCFVEILGDCFEEVQEIIEFDYYEDLQYDFLTNLCKHHKRQEKCNSNLLKIEKILRNKCAIQHKK